MIDRQEQIYFPDAPELEYQGFVSIEKGYCYGAKYPDRHYLWGYLTREGDCINKLSMEKLDETIEETRRWLVSLVKLRADYLHHKYSNINK